MIDPAYRQFSREARLHRRLIGLVDQKVGHEKQIMRKYISALDRRLSGNPNAGEFFKRWRREQGMSDRPGAE
jgi:hypothetical protein